MQPNATTRHPTATCGGGRDNVQIPFAPVLQSAPQLLPAAKSRRFSEPRTEHPRNRTSLKPNTHRTDAWDGPFTMYRVSSPGGDALAVPAACPAGAKAGCRVTCSSTGQCGHTWVEFGGGTVPAEPGALSPARGRWADFTSKAGH